MNILGIDPGSRITGFGLISVNKLNFTYINSGCIRTKGEFNERIVTIFLGIKEILENNQIDIVVIERAFMRPDRPNPDAAIKLGTARGAIISAVGIQEIPIIDYSPNQIKKNNCWQRSRQQGSGFIHGSAFAKTQQSATN